MIVCEEVDIPSQPKCHPAVFDILKNILNVELSLEKFVIQIMDHQLGQKVWDLHICIKQYWMF